ncbi:methyltransferase-like protein 13 [Quillaja saponaria]|uniref:Methyltransferase-like protein 13 n=1 Tax=Quillaja saponaria TaxID=32244 RepID=A0AAD7M5Y7_QUISA|nr:methyltransferase-like protein 13 [Quillaja saponaria]KAJ7970538.1 methyltransferase-like protein 13 [Quillaja saponaria]
MAIELDGSTFETISPSRFISFTFPNPSRSNSLLRVAVIDLPIQPTDSPQVAAMFVPAGRETDWIFSTESGHLQILFKSPGISRLTLIGKQPVDGDYSQLIYNRPLNKDSLYQKELEGRMKPLLLALSPKSLLKNGIPEIPILTYEDNVVCSLVLEKCVGSVGEMLVEDVEIESETVVGVSRKREFRRRLRFKRMPNLIQTEIRIVQESDFGSSSAGIGEVKFKPDLEVLVHPYLAPMVASLSLIGDYIEQRIRHGLRPKALCIGVGGGALLSFLRTQLGFEVTGVDEDEEVLRVARQYFGLEDDQFMHVSIGDGIKFIKKLAYPANKQKDNCYFGNGEDVSNKFDVLMVDLDSSDVRSGVSAPPLDFIRKHVLLDAILVLSDSGILTINVIPTSKSFHDELIHDLGEVFQELYKIDVGNGENFVLVATVSPIVSSIGDYDNSFLILLRSVISEAYINSIRKI